MASHDGLREGNVSKKIVEEAPGGLQVKLSVYQDSHSAAICSEADCHCVQVDSLLGFIFGSMLGDDADTQILDCEAELRQLYAASSDTGETQRAILGYVQKLVTDSTHAAGLLGRTPPILKALCDIGLLTKDAVLEWHADGGGQSEPTGAAGKVREAAEPFVDRLRASQQRAAAAESCVDELERALEDAMRAAELERERAAARAGPRATRRSRRRGRRPSTGWSSSRAKARPLKARPGDSPIGRHPSRRRRSTLFSLSEAENGGCRT